MCPLDAFDVPPSDESFLVPCINGVNDRSVFMSLFDDNLSSGIIFIGAVESDGDDDGGDGRDTSLVEPITSFGWIDEFNDGDDLTIVEFDAGQADAVVDKLPLCWFPCLPPSSSQFVPSLILLLTSLITGPVILSLDSIISDDDDVGILDGLMMEIPSGEVIRVTGTTTLIDLWSLFFNELLSLLHFLDCCSWTLFFLL